MLDSETDIIERVLIEVDLVSGTNGLLVRRAKIDTSCLFGGKHHTNINYTTAVGYFQKKHCLTQLTLIRLRLNMWSCPSLFNIPTGVLDLYVMFRFESWCRFC